MNASMAAYKETPANLARGGPKLQHRWSGDSGKKLWGRNSVPMPDIWPGRLKHSGAGQRQSVTEHSADPLAPTLWAGLVNATG